MATTTPNYGWDVPTSTDYVKDGATAIETLGDDVDASMFAALNGKPARSVLLNTTTITNQSTVTVSNVFNSTYTNYQLVLSVTGAASTNQEVVVRMASGGTPVTTTTYAWAAGGADTAGNGSNTGSTTTPSIPLTFIGSPANNAFANFTIANPFLTVATSIQGIWTYDDGAFLIARTVSGKHRNATSYDGFSLLCGMNFTGSVRIYGIKDS
jgi:hypothetical protein